MAQVTDGEGSLASDMRTLLESGEGADVTLVVGDSELPAHSLVLQARSSVFAAMLRSDMREALTRRIEITDMQEVVLQQMLLFMYTQTVPELESMAGELLAAADKYNLPLLKKLCEQRLAEDLNVENAAATAALAMLHRCPGLKASAVEFMASHPEVLATAGWAQLLRGGAEAAVEISSQLAWLLPPRASADRTLSTDEKQKLAQRLTAAAAGGRVEEVQELLAAGAPADGNDGKGNTALHLAVLNRQAESVRCLLDAGADVNATDSSNQTPLHCAAVAFDVKIMCMLIAASARVEAQDRWGKTPLHWAAETSPGAVRALLSAGASTSRKDNRYMSPGQVATTATKALFNT